MPFVLPIHTSLNRPALKKVRTLILDQQVQAILCYDLDRLSRKRIHQALLTEELDEAGITLFIVTMPEGRKTPELQLLVRIPVIPATQSDKLVLGHFM